MSLTIERLASTGDLAKIFEVDRSAVYYWQRQDGFPEVLGTVAGAKVWRVSDVEKWRKAHLGDREKPGPKRT